MSLKRYRIDASSLPLEDRKKTLKLIENNSWYFNLIADKPGAYEAFYDENFNLLQVPFPNGCIVTPLFDKNV